MRSVKSLAALYTPWLTRTTTGLEPDRTRLQGIEVEGSATRESIVRRARLVRDIADELALTDEVLRQHVGGRDLTAPIVAQVEDEAVARLEAVEHGIHIAT